jgi:hypothetical protein
MKPVRFSINMKQTTSNQEILRSLRKPTLPPSRHHGDMKKERNRKNCRNKNF